VLSTPPAVDVECIARSVIKEFRLKATFTINIDPRDPDLVHLTVRYMPSKKETPVLLRCGNGASPLSVRQSLLRQLRLLK
jgi:hypothetical protein